MGRGEIGMREGEENLFLFARWHSFEEKDLIAARRRDASLRLRACSTPTCRSSPLSRNAHLTPCLAVAGPVETNLSSHRPVETVARPLKYRISLFGFPFVRLLEEKPSGWGDETRNGMEEKLLGWGDETRNEISDVKRAFSLRKTPTIIIENRFIENVKSLRVDALCLLLSMANVGAYSDILVLDMVGGLLTGSVAERLGGTGFVCSTYFGTMQNPIDIVRMFNFSSDVNSRIVQVPFSDLCLEHKNGETTGHHGNQISETSTNDSLSSSDSLILKSCMHVSEDAAFEEVNVSSEISGASQEISYHKNSWQASQETHLSPDVESEQDNSITFTVEKYITPGRRASSEVIKLWKDKGFTSLIVAAPEIEVESVVAKLLPLLSYSAPFAIYHHCLQGFVTGYFGCTGAGSGMRACAGRAWPLGKGRCDREGGAVHRRAQPRGRGRSRVRGRWRGGLDERICAQGRSADGVRKRFHKSAWRSYTTRAKPLYVRQHSRRERVVDDMRA
ncbi:hypothetical protein AXF42_Ash000859 [Apostasia shenzhenica]|uniref:tRNA (adenine(58)-N(1))-methyltransferase non-catalytic subunit TRM6 n=1 Tax=Apostasia shenzhenica TaxID=1088818 RepID=A0A2I0ATD4_9ASPA|nr:hypothetical protein AXF42_Ash000859 [Apostasia shenzhenica]